MIRKSLSLLLALAMIFSLVALAGCDKNGKTKGPNISGTGDTSDEDYFLDMPSELQGTTVKFATWVDHSATNTSVALAGFEETTGMKYQMVQVDQANYITKMTSLIASDESPDVVVENGEFPRTLKLVQPLSKETNGLDATDPFWDQRASERYKIGNCYYFVNGANTHWNADSTITYFHRTILEENGIKTPADYVEENNWTVDTLFTLLKQIKNGVSLNTAPAKITMASWLHIYNANQVKWDTEQDKFINCLTDDTTKAAMKKIMEAQDEGLATVIDNHDDGITTGTHIIQMAGGYGLKQRPGWFEAMDVNDLGYTYLPKLNASDENYPVSVSTRAYGICKGAKNAKGAAYFIRYFLNDAHYEMDSVYKSDEAMDLAAELRKLGDTNKIDMTRAVSCTVDSSFRTTLQYIDPMLKGTAAQVDVNLASAANNFNAAVNESNNIIKDVLESQ